MLVRVCAIRVEKSRPAREKRSRVTIRRALLYYRFRQPAAKLSASSSTIWALLCSWLPLGLFVLVFDDRSWVPAIVTTLPVLVGWAVFLRYWAVSLEARAGGGANRVPSSESAVSEPQKPSPIGGPPVDAPLQQQQLPPPGWYPNPSDTGGQAHWNGRAWVAPGRNSRRAKSFNVRG
jgi:hypothetical protein